MVVLGIVASRNGRSRNGRVRNGRSRIGRSRIGTSTEFTNGGFFAYCFLLSYEAFLRFLNLTYPRISAI